MKVNIILTLISIILAALVGYLVFNVASGEENDLVCGIGSGICYAITLIPSIGLQYGSGRRGVNIRVFSIIFFIFLAISNFCFAGFGINMPYYIIVNGIILMIYLAIFYKIFGMHNI